jgi:hypothetical protein
MAAGIAVVLLARPWLQPAQVHALLARDAACCAAVLPAAALAWVLWAGRGAARWMGAACLVGAAAAGPWGAAVAIVALPAVASLRRMAPAVVDEARVGGAGWARVAGLLLLPEAAPGLAYGVALALAPGGAWRLVAAALPLLWWG